MVNGGFWTSTCCTTRAKWALRRRGPPQQGQTSRVCSTKRLTCSGGNGSRSCLGWPGWPPMERLPPSAGSGGLGLTMSEEGGLDEVEEFLRAAASCSRNRAISACKESTCACNRWQPAHAFWAAVSILLFYVLIDSPAPCA